MKHPQWGTRVNRVEELLKAPTAVLKSTDGPVIAWFCYHNPPEITPSAGLIPYAIIPEPTSEMADSSLHGNFRPLTKSSLGKALRGDGGCVEASTEERDPSSRGTPNRWNVGSSPLCSGFSIGFGICTRVVKEDPKNRSNGA
jgi:hypothetical protein